MPTTHYNFLVPTGVTRIANIPYEIGLLAEQLDNAIYQLSAGSGSGQVPTPPPISAAVDLNSHTSPGTWAQIDNPANHAARHFPVQSSGFLQVFATSPVPTAFGQILAQTYLTAFTESAEQRMFMRQGRVSNVPATTTAWGPWKDLTNRARHADFTVTASQATNGAVLPHSGNFAEIPASTINNDFATASGTAITLTPGTYAINYAVDMGNTMGPGAYLGIFSNAGVKLYGNSLVPNVYSGAFNHPCLYVPVTTTYKFYVRQDSGAVRTSTAVVNIEKIN